MCNRRHFYICNWGLLLLTFPLCVLIVKYASDSGTGALCFFGEEGLDDFSPFFGGDELARAAVSSHL